MIVDAILSLLLGIFSFLLGLFPSFTTPVLDFSNGGSCTFAVACTIGQNTGGYLGRWINADLWVAAYGIAVTALAVAGTTKVVMWVYDKFPGKAS